MPDFLDIILFHQFFSGHQGLYHVACIQFHASNGGNFKTLGWSVGWLLSAPWLYNIEINEYFSRLCPESPALVTCHHDVPEHILGRKYCLGAHDQLCRPSPPVSPEGCARWMNNHYRLSFLYTFDLRTQIRVVLPETLESPRLRCTRLSFYHAISHRVLGECLLILLLLGNAASLLWAHVWLALILPQCVRIQQNFGF